MLGEGVKNTEEETRRGAEAIKKALEEPEERPIDKEDDIEDKIEVICPKNNFSKNIFDKSKKTIILYNENDTYEPIYMYKRTPGTHWQVKKMFSEEDFQHRDFRGTGLRKTIEVLIDNFEKMCDPKTSMKHYDYNENKPLNKLLDFNEKANKYEITNDTATYSVIKQLYNTQYQVIAVLLDIGDNKKFALPCAPSAINLNIEKGEYEAELKEAILSKKDTETILREFDLYDDEERLVVDKDCIVGLRTNTNQVVLIDPEGSNCEDRDKKDKMLMEYELDRKIMNNYPKQDPEREDIIKKIKLESNFYLMFRNLFKILINKKEKQKTKEFMYYHLNRVTNKVGVRRGEKRVFDEVMGYKKRMIIIEDRLRSVMEPHIEWFGKISIDVNIDDILNCLDMNKGQCEGIRGKGNDICTFKDGKSCRLYFPETNLMYKEAKVKNDIIYYKKLADELIRYKKIRDYVLKNDTFMNYDKVEYKINNDEIVIISNMFYKIYPNNIESIDHSEFIKNHSIYDNTNIKDGDIKKYSRELRMPEYNSDEDDDIFSDEEEGEPEDVGVVEQKTAPVAKKKEAKKKKGEPKKKTKGAKNKEGMGLIILHDYIMTNYKDYKVSDFKEIKFVKSWKERWEHYAKIWGTPEKPKLNGSFNFKPFWFEEDGKTPNSNLYSLWDSDDNILKVINLWEDDQKGWLDEYTNNVKEMFLQRGQGVNLGTIWRYSIDCLFRFILIDKTKKGNKVKDNETMEIVLKKWITDGGCKAYYKQALKE